MAQTPPLAQSPQVLNERYRLERTIGTGGMANVFMARDLMLERMVAIKVLREDFSADAAFRERFRQEARAAANLSHPNIVTVHDFGYDSGRLFLVMEYVPGSDLKAQIGRLGRYGLTEALQILIQICAGVGYAHRAGLIHCDIKPQNLLVTPDQRIKVTDFGIARAFIEAAPGEKTSVVWGSPQYFSPEQASGLPVTPATDVYSLGIVMYEMLTGQLPFIASTAAELSHLHRNTPPVPPSKLNPAIPPNLERIILKVLSKEPAARYRTADQLGRVLISSTRVEGNDPAQSQATPQRRSLKTAPLPSQPAPAASQLAPVQQTSKPAASQPQAAQAYPLPPQQAQPSAAQPVFRPVSGPFKPAENNPLQIDWSLVTLGLLAMLAVGGLIPFWLWIFFLYNPPAR